MGQWSRRKGRQWAKPKLQSFTPTNLRNVSTVHNSFFFFFFVFVAFAVVIWIAFINFFLFITRLQTQTAKKRNLLLIFPLLFLPSLDVEIISVLTFDYRLLWQPSWGRATSYCESRHRLPRSLLRRQWGLCRPQRLGPRLLLRRLNPRGNRSLGVISSSGLFSSLSISPSEVLFCLSISLNMSAYSSIID